MINCSSSVDRDIPSDSEFMENSNAESLNNANEIVIPTPTIDTRSAVDGSFGNGSAFTANTKSETIVIKPTAKETK